MKYLSLITLLAFSSLAIADSPLPNNRHISVTGTAKLQTIPDIVVVVMEAESLKVKSVDAKKDVDDKVNLFLASLKNLGIDESNVSASTISTEPYYSYSTDNKEELEGYAANRTLKVTLEDINNLNALLDFALSVQINEINNIEFKSSNERLLKDEVNALAVKNAKEKGKSLAQAFNATLGKIYSINSNSNRSRYRYGANDEVETIQVSGIRSLNRLSKPGKYLQENIIFSASISVVFDLEVESQ